MLSTSSAPIKHVEQRRYSSLVVSLYFVFSLVFCAVSVFVSGRALFLIATTCSNALGTDYVHAMPFIDNALNHGLDPSIPFARDIHSLVIPRLMHLLNALMFSWDARVELFVCFAILVLRTVFTYSCLRFEGSRSAELLLLGLILFVNFGTCNSSILFSGQPATSFGLSGLFFVLGIWAWAVLKPSAGLVMLVACAGLSSYCVANWPVCWIAFSLLLIASKTSLRKALLAGAGTLFLASPVILNMLSQRIGTNDGVDRSNLLAMASTFVNTIGRPFCNDIAIKFSALPMSTIAGIEGLLLCAVALWFFRRRLHDKRTQCAIAFIVYGAGSSLITSLSRGYITPWYVTFGCYFWTGVGALAIALIDVRSSSHEKSRLEAKLGCLIGILFICLFSINYARSNVTYKDKDWYRRTHTPSAEASLRNYRTMPTYAEQFLFAGEVGDLERVTKLSVPLERHGLSAFTPSYEESLQGDYVFPGVVSDEVVGSTASQWVLRDRPDKKLSWKDAEHLCLKMDSRNAVTWRIVLPQGSAGATFRTAVRGIPKRGQSLQAKVSCFHPAQNNAVPVIRIFPVGESFTSVMIPIDASGTVEIKLESTSGDAGCLLFDYPTVSVSRRSRPRTLESPVLCPDNTELSKNYPRYTENDLVLNPGDSETWQYKDLARIRSENPDSASLKFKTQGVQPTLTLRKPLDVNVQEYSHFCFTLSGSHGLSKPRVACVQFIVNGSALRTELVPLLFDDGRHSYSFDLKLLELSECEHLTGICLLPVYMRSPNECAALQLHDIRLVRRVTRN